VFVTDVATMNHMYVLRGFRLPDNVICENGTAVERHLLVNKEPPGSAVFRFASPPTGGILINTEGLRLGKIEPEFLRYLKTHDGRHTSVAPLTYKPLLKPLVPILGPISFAVQSHGGEVVTWETDERKR